MRRLSFLLMVPASIVPAMLAGENAPPAAKQPVTDVYHGVSVTDDYRWLEDWSNPATRQWSEAENAYARSYLDALPARKAVASQLERLMGNPSPSYYSLTSRAGSLFALRRTPPNQQPLLVVLRSPDDPGAARVILDPTVIDASGQTAIDFYVPSTDGKLVAVSMSKGGSENGNVHVYEAATGKPLADVIPRVNGGTAGGSVAWNAGSSGFWYTRYPRSGERPPADLDFFQQVWFHRLGTDTAEDTYSLGKDFPRIAEVALKSSDDGRVVLARMANGDGGEYAHYLLLPGKEWMQVASLADEVTDIEFGQDRMLYFLSRRDAPMGKILKSSLDKPGARDARLLVPEAKVAIRGILPSDTHLYAMDLAGGPSDVRIFDLEGKPQGKVPIPEVSAVYQGVRIGKAGAVLFDIASYLLPAAWYKFDAASASLSRTALHDSSSADYSDIEVPARVREFEGWHQGAAEHPAQEGYASSTAGTRRC